MNYKKYIIVLTTFVLPLLLFSCREIKELEYRDFQNFSVGKLGFSSTTLKIDLIYYNPNNFGLQLKRTDLDIFINNNFAGHATQEYQITIPKRSDFAIPLQLEVDMKNLYKTTFNALFNQKVTVKMNGVVKIGKANVFKSFVINYVGEQELKLLK